MGLVITGLGMVSSVGWGVIQSCASIRAGITRPRLLLDCTSLDEDLLEPVPVFGHPVATCTEGFGPIGRWLRLAQASVEDLRRTSMLPSLADARFWERTGWICVLPRLDGARFLEVQEHGPELMVGTYEERLGALLHLPRRPRAIHELCLGHAGTAHAVLLAEQLLREGRYERVVILATDSYLDGSSLEWLLAHRRLKTPEHPVGLMPGEAGACLLVELHVSARRRQAPLLANVEATATDHEPKAFLSPKPNRNVGEGLARATAKCISSTPLEGRFAGDILIDLNGEDWRAREWGYAQVRLSKLLSERTRPVMPCISIGDIGAASGAAGICMAVRSFARKYSLSRHTLVLSSSEHGDVGALCLQAPGDRS